ncbi:hypothetical protein [Streptomyces sp. NPDC047990]
MIARQGPGSAGAGEEGEETPMKASRILKGLTAIAAVVVISVGCFAQVF